jgi:cytochrome c-type biogenesis protein
MLSLLSIPHASVFPFIQQQQERPTQRILSKWSLSFIFVFISTLRMTITIAYIINPAAIVTIPTHTLKLSSTATTTAIRSRRRIDSMTMSIQPPRSITTTRRIRSKLHLSFLSNWDDILYQTQSLGNSLASLSFQQIDTSAITSGTFSSLSTNTGGISSSNNMIMAFPIMYGAGLFTSFSPCVWGLLPLTISYISTAANERTDQQTILPTIAFATGLATVFCTMGIIAVSIGSVFGSVTTISSSSSEYNHNNAVAWTGIILPIISNFVCFIMGLKLLDLIDIPLPSFNFLNTAQLFPSTTNDSSTSRSTGPIFLDATGRQVGTRTTMTSSSTTAFNNSNQQKQNEDNSLFRTFLLGGSSALVASPCATPVLTSILAFVANTAESSSSSSSFVSTTIGAFLLFGYTLGYSTPLLIVAATSGQALVQLKQQKDPTLKVDGIICNNNNVESDNKSQRFQWAKIPNMIAPWVTPITGGILLYFGTTGLLINIIGDPSLVGLTIIE